MYSIIERLGKVEERLKRLEETVEKLEERTEKTNKLEKEVKERDEGENLENLIRKVLLEESRETIDSETRTILLEVLNTLEWEIGINLRKEKEALGWQVGK